MFAYILAVFRSRTQVLYFRRLLRNAGIGCEITSTPSRIAIGCGLSVKIRTEDLPGAEQVYKAYAPTSFVGFYGVNGDKIQALRRWS